MNVARRQNPLQLGIPGPGKISLKSGKIKTSSDTPRYGSQQTGFGRSLQEFRAGRAGTGRGSHAPERDVRWESLLLTFLSP